MMDIQRAVRSGDWKLIRYPEVNVTQLFDLHADPYEMHDVSRENPVRVRDLTALLAQLQKANDDTLPLTRTTYKDPAVTAEKVREQARLLLLPRPVGNRR